MFWRPRATTRWTAIIIFLAIFAIPGIAVVVNPVPSAAQVTPLEDEPDVAPNLGRITGSPDPGPAPEDAGDRGGLIQLVLAIILFIGLLFIATRIRAEVQRNRLGAKPESRGPQ